MARKSIIACDGPHGEALRESDGRVGVQVAGGPVQWKDACGECLAKAQSAIQVQLGKGSAGATRRLDGSAREPVKRRIEGTLRKRGPMPGTQLAKLVGVTPQVLYGLLGQMKSIRKQGDRAGTLWSLRNGSPAHVTTVLKRRKPA